MKHFLFSALFVAAFAFNANAYMFQTFESLSDIWVYEEDETTIKEGTFFVYNNSFAPMQLVDNPKKEGINKSDKVVAVNVYVPDFSPNSGIIKINFVDGTTPKITYPANPLGTGDDIPVYYDVLRFKYYKGNLLSKNVEFEPNGSPTSPKTIRGAMGEDEWEYITIPLEWKSYSNFQIRVNRNETGDGSAAGTQPGEIIYIDDFEVYNNDAGPEDPNKIKLTIVDNNFSCVRVGDNQFRLNSTIDNTSDVQVDLVSVSGQVSTIYNQTTQGAIEVPFKVESKGVYFVRMIVDGKYSSAQKIIAQ